MSKRTPVLYLQDILSSINNIQDYLKNTPFQEFCLDRKTIDAVVRNFEIIGEATSRVPSDIKDKYRNIPWQKIVSTRHKMIHEYSGIDLQIVWKTCNEDLPILKKDIIKILDSLKI